MASMEYSTRLMVWHGPFGLLNSDDVLQARLADNQLKDYSDSSIGWIFGVFYFFLFVIGI